MTIIEEFYLHDKMTDSYQQESQNFAITPRYESSLELTFTFESDSPIECLKLKLVAFVFILVFISSAYLNSSILWVFLKTKKLNVSINLFLFFLILYNLIGTLLEFPLVITNHFNCGYRFFIYIFE